jgi:excisionase family DNA binding protein
MTVPTFTPSTTDRTQASDGLVLLKSGELRLTQNRKQVVFQGESTVLKVVRQVLEGFAKGEAITVQRVTAELTTQQAADLLGVSRPHLVKLLETGKIPFRKVGVQRRVLLSEVKKYHKRLKRQRHKGLDELSVLQQELGLYDGLYN